MSTLPNMLNPDTIPVLLRKQLGVVFSQDAELNLLAEMPLRLPDQVTNSAVSTAATTAGFIAGDATKLTTELTRRKAGK